MTLNEFLAKYAPQFRVEPVSFRPGGGWRKGNHFLFQIRDGDDNQYVSFYSQGIGIYDKYSVPKMRDVFQCLQMDFGCGVMTRKEYMEELGNDVDSLTVWDECPQGNRRLSGSIRYGILPRFHANRIPGIKDFCREKAHKRLISN